MIPPEAADIVEMLLDKSRQKKVPWVNYDGPDIVDSGDDYIVHFADYSINIYVMVGSAVGFRVIDSKGDVIMSFQCESTEVGYDSLSELIELARRIANNVDEALDAIRRRLMNL